LIKNRSNEPSEKKEKETENGTLNIPSDHQTIRREREGKYEGGKRDAGKQTGSVNERIISLT
jgi:hypothetical protein